MKCRQSGECHMKCYFVSPDEGDPSYRPDTADRESGPGITSLPATLLARHGARVLDPSTVPTAAGWPPPRPTVYRARTLLLPPPLHQEPYRTSINDVLARAGMSLATGTPPDHGDDPAPDAVVGVLSAV